MSQKKNLLFAISALSLSAISMQNYAFASDYVIDKDHTSVRFEISHLVVSTVAGVFKDFSGQFSFDDKDEKKINIDAKAMVNSISTDNEKRDKHLKSPDFFDAAKFPEISFKSKSVKKTGDKTYDITGDFSMHGITKTVTFKGQYLGTMKAFGKDRIGLKAETKINRQDFKMAFSTLVDATPLVGDEISIFINLEGIMK